MADFTEEYLRRLTDVENQKVAQLSGIKDALEGSGSGGGTGCSCLGVKVTTTLSDGSQATNRMITNRTAREVVGAVESGDGVSVYVYVSLDESQFVCRGQANWSLWNNEQGSYGLNVTPFGETQTISLMANSLDDYFAYSSADQDDPSMPVLG